MRARRPLGGTATPVVTHDATRDEPWASEVGLVHYARAGSVMLYASDDEEMGFVRLSLDDMESLRDALDQELAQESPLERVRRHVYRDIEGLQRTAQESYAVEQAS